MSLYKNHFFHDVIRRYEKGFMSLFDNIVVGNYDDSGNLINRERVPIEYSPKEKFFVVTREDVDKDRQIALKLPRMGFEMTNMVYAPNRKLETTRFLTALGSSENVQHKQYNPVPYDFQFNLYIKTRHQIQGNQIIEQIAPFFTPDHYFTISAIPDMCLQTNVPVSLNGITNLDNYDGSLLQRREIIWTLSFTVKGFLFSPVQQNKNGIILDVDVSMVVDPSGTGSLINVTPDGTTITEIVRDPTYGGTISFVPASYTAPEDVGTITVVVKRLYGSAGFVTADYTTVPGTALAGVDYQTNTGTLSWNDEDSTDRYITLNIIDDNIVEPPKEFYVSLSNIVGADTGIFTATINIQDTDAPTFDQTATTFDTDVITWDSQQY